MTPIEEVFEIFDTNGIYSKGSMIVINIYELQEAVEKRVKEAVIESVMHTSLKEAYEAGQQSMYCGCYEIDKCTSFLEWFTKKGDK